MNPRYLLIANPGTKRCEAYLAELRAFWAARGQAADIELLPWRDIVSRDGNLDGLTDLDRPAIVRIESPGKDFEVTRLLLQAGARETGECGEDWLALSYDKGRQVRPGLLYRGLCRVLAGLHGVLVDRPHLRATACPRDIAQLFDKNATCARLAAAGLPVPETITAASCARDGSISQPVCYRDAERRGRHSHAERGNEGFSSRSHALRGNARSRRSASQADRTMNPVELLDDLRRRRFPTAYVKLNSGSSASSMAVVRPLEEPVWAWSSLVRLNGGFYSTRRLCRYQADDLHAVLGFLLAEGACVQRGVPMAQIDGQNFDLRVVMLHGRPIFHIFRLSGQPMTNLHFGGRRGDLAACRAAIPTRAWLDAMDHCREAARLYNCDMVGIDLLFERGFRQHYILEINAFGDFFPGLRDDQGRSVHAVQIEASAEGS